MNVVKGNDTNIIYFSESAMGTQVNSQIDTKSEYLEAVRQYVF